MDKIVAGKGINQQQSPLPVARQVTGIRVCERLHFFSLPLKNHLLFVGLPSKSNTKFDFVAAERFVEFGLAVTGVEYLLAHDPGRNRPAG